MTTLWRLIVKRQTPFCIKYSCHSSFRCLRSCLHEFIQLQALTPVIAAAVSSKMLILLLSVVWLLFLAHQIGISVVLPISHIPYQPEGKMKNKQPHAGRKSIRDVIVMLKWRHHVASQRIQYFLEVFYIFFFNIKWGIYVVVSEKKNPLFVWGWDRKIRPSGSPFVITRQASWCQTLILGRIFLSHPHTHNYIDPVVFGTGIVILVSMSG